MGQKERLRLHVVYVRMETREKKLGEVNHMHMGGGWHVVQAQRQLAVVAGISKERLAARRCESCAPLSGSAGTTQ